MLDERQIEVARLIAQGTPIIEITRQVNVARSTIYEWKKLEEFTAEVDSFGQEFISSAKGRLKCAAKDAADEIIKLLKGGKYEKTRLAAAVDILDRNLGKATTRLDIDDKRDNNNTPSDDMLENVFSEIDSKDSE